MSCGSGRARSLAACAALAAALSVAPAGAQSPPAPDSASSADEQRRTALYKEGFDAATAGRWEEARKRFEAALAIRTSPKVLFSLAQAEEQLGRLASASRDYGRARDLAKAASEGEVVSAASSAIAALDPRVPKVRIVVSGAATSTATLDGAAVATGAPVPVDPGSHRVVVSAPGMHEVDVTVAIGAGQHLDLPVSMEAGTATVASPVPSQPDAGSQEATPSTSSGAFPWRTVGLVAGGVGVVTLGIGTYFGLQAKSKNDQSNSSGCAPNNDCTASAAAIRRDAISAGNTSTVLFVAGGVLAAGGVALWLLAPSTTSQDHVGVAARASADGVGLVVDGRW